METLTFEGTLTALTNIFTGGDDKTGVEVTLRRIDYIVNDEKVAYGYGMFRSVSVEETAEDYSFVKDGVAMRPLPSVLFRSDENMMLAFKPPYWDKTNVRSCVPPGAKILG